ncbi:MAG TPA: divalent metal cation transporter [Bacteroidales bacterium]
MKKFLQILGPGLLYAGAAIGVSHLVQSTRAGAMYNFDLIWVLLLANFLKYPFFEYGPRYAIATGQTLIQGYEKTGKWAVAVFAILTVASMFIITAAITVVTVGLLANILKLNISLVELSIFILFAASLVLIVGKFSVLDKIMKFIIVLLTLSTVVALFSALGVEKEIAPDFFQNFKWTKAADIFFLIAFVGWMPAPIDISVWSSIWNIEKNKQLGYVPKLKSVLFEFRVGYIGTALLAVCFLGLGALVMFGTGEVLSENGTLFSEQLISMYTLSIGNWAYWIIAIAAFTTMLSTVITVIDAYSRVMNILSEYYIVKLKTKVNLQTRLLIFWLLILVSGTLIIIIFFAKSMVFMVTIATTISFLMAPIFAWLNYKVVTDKHMPAEFRPSLFLRILSWIGIAFLIGFSAIYLYWQYLS